MLKAKATAITGQFSRFTLRKRSFEAWKIAYERSLREAVRHLRAVSGRGQRSVLKYYWARWVRFNQGKSEEREIHMRTQHKWAAVQSWLRK
jgi:hypothetical protein